MMSFQDFQKAPNRLTSREIVLLVLTGSFVILVLYILVESNYYLTNFLPGGGEYYLLRTAGRSFLFDHIEPYSANVPERVQGQVYGHPAEKGEDLYILDIPFHLLILYFPLAVFPDASMTRAFWMTLLELALLGSIYLCFRLLDRRVPYFFIALISLGSFASFYAYDSLLEGSPALLLGFAYVGILLSLRAGLDEVAGALMTFSAFQWEIGGLFLLFVVLWALWEKRGRVFAGAGMLAFVLLAFSFLLYPGWFMPFLRASWNSFRVGFGYSMHDILSQLWPQFGSLLGWTLTAILIVTLGYEWRAARGANFRRFIWAACLTLVAAPLLGYPVEMDQLIPLTMPIILIIVYSRERWLKLGNGIAFFVLLFFFGAPWLLFIKGVPQGLGLQTDQALFLFWPVFAVVGLYWVRWWVIRPPRTWLDSLQRKGR
jgi:hypothetical protein